MAWILLCDDEGIQRAALRVIVERLRDLPLPIEEIREAVHGQQAVEICATWHPDIVFLDLRMPMMGGLEAAKAIRQISPESQIIILTAYDEFNFAQEAIQIGVEDYLLKPANSQDLERVLQKTMTRIKERQAQTRMVESLYRRLEEAKPLIQQEYINDLLTTSKLSWPAVEERRRFLGLTEHPRLAMVAELDDFTHGTEGLNETERQLLKEHIRLIIERELSQPAALLHRLGGDRLAILLPALPDATDRENHQFAIRLAGRIQSAVNRELEQSISFGIGKIVCCPADLHRSFSDALQAVWHKSVLGNNSVIHINDLDCSGEGQALPAEEEMLLQALRLGNREQLDSLVKTLLGLIERQELGRLETEEWRAIELLVLMTRAALLGGANLQQATMANVRYLREIAQATSWQDICQTVNQAAEGFLTLVLAERNLRHQKLMEKAKLYMQQHYCEPLTLEDMARVIYLSPFYFSHVFKEQAGMTFVEYLTNLRLNAARHLLRDRQLPVGQIAEQVGYNDVNYFSRVFKKVVGLTPTEYRIRLVGTDKEL